MSNERDYSDGSYFGRDAGASDRNPHLKPCAACAHPAGATLCLECEQQVHDGHYERNVAPYEPREEVEA